MSIICTIHRMSTALKWQRVQQHVSAADMVTGECDAGLKLQMLELDNAGGVELCKRGLRHGAETCLRCRNGDRGRGWGWEVQNLSTNMQPPLV